MKLSLIKTSTALAAVLAICSTALPVTDANAASIRVECEKRANRSKISVDGNNLIQGNYKAVVKSGSNTKTTALKASTGDEIEFDFDSDPADVEAGATHIKRTFIQGNVTGKLLNDKGFVVISDTVSCRTK
ncbi:MAG TPA: hypothetical protein VK141_05050 [Nitrosomonas sp.]|nr:hypothetical protein [Nitrosomonas sp.]